ncbi:MAG: hypothetical protein VX836_06600 [Pseudomonadota bacterium]|nr:hypothetical protein [Pseudomonadota bacterium]
MKTPHLIVAVLCCVLALVRVLGLHLHAPAHDVHEYVASAHHAQSDHHDLAHSRIVSGFDDHAGAHMDGAEIDAESPDETTGKLPALTILALFVVCTFVLLVSIWKTVARPFSPDLSPPRRRLYVLPLSQAPPLAR